MIAIHFDFEDVCVEQKIEIPGPFQFSPIGFAEPRPFNTKNNVLKAALDRIYKVPDAFQVWHFTITVFPKFPDCVRPYVLRFQVVPGERPSTVRYPGSLLKIDIVKRPAPTSPIT
jgi:hypothetical protein